MQLLHNAKFCFLSSYISCHPHTFNTHTLCNPLPLMNAAVSCQNVWWWNLWLVTSVKKTLSNANCKTFQQWRSLSVAQHFVTAEECFTVEISYSLHCPWNQWFSCYQLRVTVLGTLPTFRPDALVFYRVKVLQSCTVQQSHCSCRGSPQDSCTPICDIAIILQTSMTYCS